MFKTLVTLTLLFSLVSCHNNNTATLGSTTAGPLVSCPYGNEESVIKKITATERDNLANCYDHSLVYLANNKLLSGKITWLKNTQSDEVVEQFINGALAELGSVPSLHLELATVYIKQKQWHDALEQLNRAMVKVNEPKRLLVETHLGQYSQGTDLSLLPYIYKQIPLKKATVKQNQGTGFSLQRISDGNSSKINGEPSITNSPDGQNIWLLWTDSGQSAAVNGTFLNFWTVQSSQSRDGGNSWTPVSMNTLPNRVDRFHFDPMSIYDSANNIIYAGGMVKGFGPNWGETPDDAMFFYRWELDNDANLGPFKTFIPQPDKGWMATNANGDVTLAHHYGIEVSTDRAQSFTPVTAQIFTSAQPRFLADGCLFITDISLIITCENNKPITLGGNFSTAFFSQDDIPGTFRVFAFAQNAIHANGDIYVVYHEYKFFGSSELNIQMTKSSDNGMTWSTPWVISTDINRDQFAPWIEIDNDGGMHIVYFDTRNGVESDTSSYATVDLYYQYSDDLGQSWTETRITPTSLTLPELIWGNYFFSDYLSLSVSDQSVYLAFPWSTQEGQMHMYFAKKSIQITDLVFSNGFE
jgi:hypothetical protein